jgi:small subunit ribosomal protein S16
MATKIRLQRHGRKKRSFFHIVVADSRAPRDGRFIEKIGSYNPLTNPATIELDVNNAVNWLLKGATPSDTANAILSYKGANYKKHLQMGVIKGAITQEQADAKFATWMEEKNNQVQSKRDRLASEKDKKRSEAFKAEQARKDAIAAKVIAKNTPPADEPVVEEPAVENEVAEVSAETETVVETPAAAVTETPAAEVTETPAAEEKSESNEENAG